MQQKLLASKYNWSSLPWTSLQEELLTILLARSMFICLQWKSAVEECVAAMDRRVQWKCSYNNGNGCATL